MVKARGHGKDRCVPQWMSEKDLPNILAKQDFQRGPLQEDGPQQCCPRNQTPTAEMARARPANARRQPHQSGTEMDTTWKKEARTAKDDVATNSDGRAERDGAFVG